MEQLNIIRQLRNAKCGINPNAVFQSFMPIVKREEEENRNRTIPNDNFLPDKKEEISVQEQKPVIQLPSEEKSIIKNDFTSSIVSSSISESIIEPQLTTSKPTEKFVSDKDPIQTVLNNGGNGIFVFPNISSKVAKKPLREYTDITAVTNTFYPDFESATSKRIKLLLELKNNIDMLDSRRSDTTAGNYDAGNISALASELGVVGSGALTKTQNVEEIRKMISLYIPE